MSKFFIERAQAKHFLGVVVVVIHKYVKSFIVFKVIDLKLGTLMYYGFLINIVQNSFFLN